MSNDGKIDAITGKVLEKRIGEGIIRRRKASTPSPAAERKVEASVPAPEAAKEPELKAQEIIAQTPQGEEGVSPKVSEPESQQVSGDVEVHRRAESEVEKKKPLTIIAQPGEQKVDLGKKEGVDTKEVLGRSAPGKILTEKEEQFLKRGPRRRKSRAELDFEDIKRVGGLKHAAMIYSEDENGLEGFGVSRVFRPDIKHKKKPVKKGTKKPIVTERKATKKVIKISDGIVVSELSKIMGVKASQIIKKLLDLGITGGINDVIGVDAASIIASEYGFEVEHVAFKEDEVLNVAPAEDVSLHPCPPVVTVMGHVDHGKTSILDAIRHSNVAEKEAGGITQRIGAYTVTHNGKVITFIDTPGHEAFTKMRARGAKVTDIVVLVVAADDGVMPQTEEAIDHAKAAGVPIIVAINKIDKPGVDPLRVKRELANAGLMLEEWGGDTICVNTSAKTGEGIDTLLEMILLQADMLELKARHEGRAMGFVIESRMDKRRGPSVTVIVKEGKLKAGDVVISGNSYGKVRLMHNDKGDVVKEVLPSYPAEVFGLSGVPEAGEKFVVVEDEDTARSIIEARAKKAREGQLADRKRISLEELGRAGGEKELKLILKADESGVVDAIKDAIPALSTSEVSVRIIHTGVGGITESDIILAAASGACVVGFGVVPDVAARQAAAREKVEIRTYSIIYEMLDDIKKAVSGMLSPREVETVIGRAVVKETFKIPKLGTIAGCSVTFGKIARNGYVRVLRDNVVCYDGKIASLKRFKDDVREVEAGKECGVGIENFDDIKVGDELEVYTKEVVSKTWEEGKASS